MRFLKRLASTVKLSLDPITESAKNYFIKGAEYFEAGEIGLALSEFKNSAAVKGTSDAYFNIGNCHVVLGNYVEAVDNFTRSCSLEPTEDAYCNSANVLALHLKNPLEAAKLLELASDLSPRDGEIRFNRGVILESIGKLEDAISEYEKAADFGIEKAADHLRNCSVKLIQEKFKIQEQEKKV